MRFDRCFLYFLMLQRKPRVIANSAWKGADPRLAGEKNLAGASEFACGGPSQELPTASGEPLVGEGAAAWIASDHPNVIDKGLELRRLCYLELTCTIAAETSFPTVDLQEH